MTATDARATVLALLHRIAPERDVTALADDALVQEELGLDSMDFLVLMTALEDEAGITVPERDYPRLATLAGCVAYVQEAQG